jgi:hypothetical protein
MALFRIITPSAALRSGSFANAALDSECLFGEAFEAETIGKWIYLWQACQ